MLDLMGKTASRSVCVNAPSWRWFEQLPSGGVCTLGSWETMVRLSSGIRLMTLLEKWACQRRHLMTTCTCFAWDASTTSPSRRAGTIRLASCATSSIRPSNGKNSNQESRWIGRAIMRIWWIWALLQVLMSKIMSEWVSEWVRNCLTPLLFWAKISCDLCWIPSWQEVFLSTTNKNKSNLTYKQWAKLLNTSMDAKHYEIFMHACHSLSKLFTNISFA